MKKVTLLIIVFTVLINLNSIGQKTAGDTFRLAASIFNKGQAAFKAKNYNEAFNLYGEAAKLNYADAFSKLGVCNELALGTNQDILKAVEWYKKGLKLNSSESGYRLGMLLIDDRIWKKPNFEEGISSLKKAADLFNAEAQYTLGNYYKWGKYNLVKSDSMAYSYYFAAAIVGGHKDAMFSLAECYKWGRGVQADPPKAFELYKIAANAGSEDAYFSLGSIYESGSQRMKVAPDKTEALKWYKKYIDSGSASDYAKELYNKLLNSQ